MPEKKRRSEVVYLLGEAAHTRSMAALLGRLILRAGCKISLLAKIGAVRIIPQCFWPN
jgi:hypothetical protein